MIGLVIVALVLAAGLLYARKGYWAWVIPIGLLLIASRVLPCPLTAQCPLCVYLPNILAGVYIVLALLFGIKPLRAGLVSRVIMPIIAGILPKIGKTEAIALNAGTVWWDGELFTGNPNHQKLLDLKIPALSDEERTFLNGPVEEVCKRIDDFKVMRETDLPSEVWELFKTHKFFGMIIPKSFGGLGFSAIAHSAVVTKLASRSVAAAVTAMVPNSLGPAELLLHYGTDEQKNHYLPRLANGEEIPCFALTGPEAGSDAASMTSEGVIEKGNFNGKEVLGMRLNWRKRYCTLGPIATVIGLAFKLRDPNHLLGQEEDLGITCALIPANLPGITIGERHDPLGVAFHNGPNFGKNVFVPLDFIIGGAKMAGHGWRMLMECLAAGRSISLPSMSTGVAQTAARAVGAYATVRNQFDIPIGRFEGIEEPLARIGGMTYLCNAARVLTAGAVDLGEKPSVLSAIVKLQCTEIMRKVVTDAMDICAGAAISRGPRNVLSGFFMASPIGITVEGANILTRSMIIFGQGAIRCHPFVRDEMEGIAEKNLGRFDKAFFGHINFVFSNMARSILLGVTGARLACAPGCCGKLHPTLRQYFRQVTRFSAGFTVFADMAMATLGGSLKRREKISARFADCLSWMYLTSAAMKRFVDDGQEKADLPFARWAAEYGLFQIQEALLGLLANFPVRPVAWLMRVLIFPFGACLKPPSDFLGSQVAHGLLDDREGRIRLTRDIYLPEAGEKGLGALEVALDHAVKAFKVQAKVKDAVRSRKLAKNLGGRLLEEALKTQVITQAEFDDLRTYETIQDDAVQVDAFSKADLRG